MSNEQQIPQEFRDWAKSESLKMTGGITYGMYEKAPKLCEEAALAAYRHLNSKPSGLKVGDKVVLDVEHNNSSVVTIRATAKYYSTVTDGNCTWEVMTNRLSAIVSAESTPTLLEEKETGIAPILKLSEWLNQELVCQESHVKSSKREFHKGALAAYEAVAVEILRLTSTPPSTPTVEPGDKNDWRPCSDQPLEYEQVLLWFEGLKTMDVGYMINGSWLKSDKKAFWCEPDMWRQMPESPINK